MGGGEDHIPFCWQEQVSRAENLLRLGVDDTLLLQPPLGYRRVPGGLSQGVQRVSLERQPPGAGKTIRDNENLSYACRCAYQAVKITEDWPHARILCCSATSISLVR